MNALRREVEARRVLADHLAQFALGGNHPDAVVVPRHALGVLLEHRCGGASVGDWVAVLPEGDVVGMFPTLADADAWAETQPRADEIIKTKLATPRAFAAHTATPSPPASEGRAGVVPDAPAITTTPELPNMTVSEMRGVTPSTFKDGLGDAPEEPKT